MVCFVAKINYFCYKFFKLLQFIVVKSKIKNEYQCIECNSPTIFNGKIDGIRLLCKYCGADYRYPGQNLKSLVETFVNEQKHEITVAEKNNINFNKEREIINQMLENIEIKFQLYSELVFSIQNKPKADDNTDMIDNSVISKIVPKLFPNLLDEYFSIDEEFFKNSNELSLKREKEKIKFLSRRKRAIYNREQKKIINELKSKIVISRTEIKDLIQHIKIKNNTDDS